MKENKIRNSYLKQFGLTSEVVANSKEGDIFRDC
jgi:hypothetical protein